MLGGRHVSEIADSTPFPCHCSVQNLKSKAPKAVAVSLADWQYTLTIEQHLVKLIINNSK